MSVDISTDISVEMSVDISVEARPICRSSVGGLSVDCRWSIGRLCYDINQKFRLSVSDL